MPTELWSEDPRSALLVGPDFALPSFDRAATPGWAHGKRAAKQAMRTRGELLSELQERLYAHGRSDGTRRVLVVVQGIDTAGKGGIARHVMGLVDPQGVAMTSFGPPTPEELRHHYLWRIRRALPRAGRIGLFDRSHYEDVLVVRVENLVDDEMWRKRYDEINRFEKSLVDDGVVVIKLALMVSYDEQGKRLMERIDRPDKRWKYNASDVEARLKWDAYQEAYDDVFRLTSTAHAPWYVLPADNKWYARLAATEILTRELVDMDLRWPRPRWRPEVQRRRLAATMSPTSLAESVAATEAIVMDAIEKSSEVRQEAFELRTSRHDAESLARARDALVAKREALLADLERTMANKRELLAAVDPALFPPQEAGPVAVPGTESPVTPDGSPAATEPPRAKDRGKGKGSGKAKKARGKGGKQRKR